MANSQSATTSPPAQSWQADRYAQHAHFVPALGQPVLDLLKPQLGERILDLGCGDGALTATLVSSGCRVVAVDGSAAQVAAARARGLDASVARAESLPFEAEFDAVFSNAVLHWVRDADAAIASVFRALKPGGRFVAELGGHRCVIAIRTALSSALARRGIDAVACDPWFFPTEEDYRTRPEARGFIVGKLMLFPRPTPLPGDISGWLETFAQPFLGAVKPDDRQTLIREVRTALDPQLYDPARGWVADYTRLRFAARRPGR
jgi:SAM-dependent methyltransferase